MMLCEVHTDILCQTAMIQEIHHRTVLLAAEWILRLRERLPEYLDAIIFRCKEPHTVFHLLREILFKQILLPMIFLKICVLFLLNSAWNRTLTFVHSLNRLLRMTFLFPPKFDTSIVPYFAFSFVVIILNFQDTLV